MTKENTPFNADKAYNVKYTTEKIIKTEGKTKEIHAKRLKYTNTCHRMPWLTITPNWFSTD